VLHIIKFDHKWFVALENQLLFLNILLNDNFAIIIEFDHYKRQLKFVIISYVSPTSFIFLDYMAHIACLLIELLDQSLLFVQFHPLAMK
jgi:hypothetical protein